MLIDATHAEETRVVVVDGTRVEEFDFETVNKRQLAGNIYLAKVTRVEPSLQAAFIEYGGNRHGFLAFAEIHPDYYQIPVADRKALMEEERAYARAQEDEEGQGRGRQRRSALKADEADETLAAEATIEAASEEAPAEPAAEARLDGFAESAPVEPLAPSADKADRIAGMDVVDLGEAETADTLFDGPADDTSSYRPNGREPDAPNGREHGADMRERASERDETIESVADEDVADEIHHPARKPRARRYKIQEVVKVRQIMLVQVVKEERGNKGAALTTYLSLAGRYCVLMPNTARGGGISRKITVAADRKKLKEIASEIEVPEGAGLIIRTAGSQRTKSEIRRDYEYLQRLWEQIRDLTLRSIAPAPIYEEGALVKRVIRDLYSREIDEVLVEGAEGYRTARDFMAMIMPDHAGAVRRYADAQPLFARYGVESYLASMFNPTVQLKSGGYIVIGVTEALVAIDVNSGRATKEGSIEETALKTNLEAAEEVARQLRLRDLAGLIVIDFIDMDERRNNAAVEKRMKDKLKSDRARVQMGRISGFGLMEMSRQRLRPGMLEASTAPCSHCHGTGLIRSDDSLALSVLRQLEEEGTRRRSREVLVRVPVTIANFLMNQKREHIAGIEARFQMAVRIEADPALVSPDFAVEKFKTSTRTVAANAVISAESSAMDDVVEEPGDGGLATALPTLEAAEPAEPSDGDASNEALGDGQGEGPRRKRRRRRRRKGSGNGLDGEGASSNDETDDEDEAEPIAAEAAAGPVDEAEAPKKRTRSSASRTRRKAEADAVAEAPEGTAEALPEAEPAPKPKRSRSRRPSAKQIAEAEAADAAALAADALPEPVPAPSEVIEAEAMPETVPEAVPETVPETGPETREVISEPVAETEPYAEAEHDRATEPVEETIVEARPEPATESAPEPEAEAKPKKRGWWSLGR